LAGYGAGGVIFDGQGRVLLVRESHPEWEPEQEPYVPPGGTVEAAETPREAADVDLRSAASLRRSGRWSAFV
jgi:ADP-ribose pyrophosphatase YjhB (NUDIX family)